MKSFFNKQHQKLIADPMGDQNPITIQVLGICSALAITTQLENALVMTLAVIFVMTSASSIISILRNHIPNRIRIIVQLLVVASLVALVDQILNSSKFDTCLDLNQDCLINLVDDVSLINLIISTNR